MNVGVYPSRQSTVDSRQEKLRIASLFDLRSEREEHARDFVNLEKEPLDGFGVRKAEIAAEEKEIAGLGK